MGEDFHLAEKLILGLLAHGPPASVQALAERIGADTPVTIKAKVFALAAAGLLEGAGRAVDGQRLWRATVKGAKAAGAPAPVTVIEPEPDPEPVAAPAPPSRPALKLITPPRPVAGKIKVIRSRPARVTQLRPMTADRARYCRWFLRADWSADVVAMLFDVDVEAVSALASG